MGVAGTGVVDGDVKGEIVGIDVQFAQLIGADQQMQGQLFIAQVVADDLWQVFVTGITQGQLHGALQIKVIVDVRGIRQVVFGKQLAIEHHMVLRGLTVPQFFQVGAQQPFETVVVPVLDHAIQPGAVDPFGRRHGLEEVQGVGLAAEELPRAAVFAPLQVVSVLPGHTGAVLLDPGLQRHGVIGHLLGERRSLCDALLEERLGDGLLVGVVGALEQSLIALAHVSVRGTGWTVAGRD